MYSKLLEKLIEFILADGQTADKEKQILFKIAEDLAEFEKMLDAKLQQINQAKKTLPTVSNTAKAQDTQTTSNMYAIGKTADGFEIRFEAKAEKNNVPFFIDCSNQNLVSLVLSSCKELKELYCSNNELTELDVSSHSLSIHLLLPKEKLLP